MDAYIEIAEAIKTDIDKILKDALSDQNKRYRYTTENGDFIKWDLVQKDINKRIDYNLLGVVAYP
jgi:hypothetical protein